MSKTKVWITGVEGNLGSTIQEMLDTMEHTVVATDMDLDITNMEDVSRYIEMTRPDIVINCAGFSGEQKCEENMARAYQVNALGARNLAAASRRINAKIIHISTDDVFSGEDTCELTEFEAAHPNTVYGKSKLAGEQFVRELNPKHLIVRSSWVYGAKGENFVKYVEKFIEEGKDIRVPNDQISSPTSATELARFIIQMMDIREFGIYHASCEGSCTRYEFAKTIVEMMGADIQVAPVSGTGTARRGRCTLLKNLMLEITGIYQMPDWKVCLKEFLDDTKEMK